MHPLSKSRTEGRGFPSITGKTSTGSFDGTLYSRNTLHRRLLVVHAEMGIPLGHLCRPVSQKFTDRV